MAGSISVSNPTLNLCFTIADFMPGSSRRRSRKRNERSGSEKYRNGSRCWNVYCDSSFALRQLCVRLGLAGLIGLGFRGAVAAASCVDRVLISLVEEPMRMIFLA